MQLISDGFLSVGDDHEIYYHEYGNRDGVPVLCFHGGPGNYSKPKHADLFNPEKHRVILFDQRGCGKSKYINRYENNGVDYTAHDAFLLLKHLQIPRVHLVSSSWGSACAINFAKQYPDCVGKMILSNIFLGRDTELNWLKQGWRNFYPDLYDFVYKNDNFQDFVDQINSGDMEKIIYSTKKFGSFERCLGNLDFNDDNIQEMAQYIPGEEHINNYKMYMFYVANNMTINKPLLQDIDVLADKEIFIIHNRLDLNCLFINAWDLHTALPNSKLVVSADIGHDTDKIKQIVRDIIDREL